MADNIVINIHSVIPFSSLNGPGCRMVVFFQGCGKKCPGCFNPETHHFEAVRLCSPEAIFSEYLRKGVEGITVSGGEPFMQEDGLYKLLKTAREVHGLATVVYTGYTYGELLERPECRGALKHIDVLVDGRYEESKKEMTLLARGSTNQEFHFLTGRYKKEDFYMPGKSEIIIGKDGTVTSTGFSSVAATIIQS